MIKTNHVVDFTKSPNPYKEFIAILVGAIFFAVLFMIGMIPKEARADYSYQTYFSEFKQVRSDCIDNIIYKDVQVGTINNTPEIESNNREIARLDEIKQRLLDKNKNLAITNGQPVYETREIASQVCTERVVNIPYCGDGIVNGKDQCDGSPNCSSSCTCNPGFLLMNSNVCQAIPMSEAQPELPRTGATDKKTIKKKK